MTVSETIAKFDMHPEELDFLGMWCGLVIMDTHSSIVFKHSTNSKQREI